MATNRIRKATNSLSVRVYHVQGCW